MVEESVKAIGNVKGLGVLGFISNCKTMIFSCTLTLSVLTSHCFLKTLIPLPDYQKTRSVFQTQEGAITDPIIKKELKADEI